MPIARDATMSQLMSDPTIYINTSEVLGFPSDVLVLKYAQAFYGADYTAAQRLRGRSHNYPDISPLPGKHLLLPSEGRLAARSVLFVGVPELNEFDYPEIREFAVRSMAVLAKELPDAQHVSM